MRVQVPLENELAVSVNVDMARAVVALPRQKDVVLSANLAHLDMLPPVVTDATWPGAGLEKGRPARATHGADARRTTNQITLSTGYDVYETRQSGNEAWSSSWRRGVATGALG